MTTLLVMTTGRSDVQVVIDGVRRELHTNTCGELHDQIAQRSWKLVDTPKPKCEDFASGLPDGDLALCTPKLDAVLDWFGREMPNAALILETRRTSRDDPRYAGAVLEDRLNRKGVDTVLRNGYLQGDERYDDKEHPRDAVVRREVVRRLEEAVRASIEQVEPERVIVATTGGFPVISNLVEEIVRLHASVRVDALEVADGAQANPPTADRAVPRTSVPEPLVSFQARRRAIELIEKGNLLGAWAVAEPLHYDDVESHWTQVVHWLARFASSLPIPDDCDIPVLSPHQPVAVRSALRVELALRAGDIPSAVHGTVAFFEAALWDWIRAHDFSGESITRISDVEYQLPQSPSPDQRKRFRKRRSDCYWRINDFSCGVEAWLHVLNKSALTTFSQVLTDDIRDLRNDVAHNEPTEELMHDARAQMQKADLWSDRDTFLSQPLVQNVLDELGVASPQALCDNLIQTVRERLLNQ